MDEWIKFAHQLPEEDEVILTDDEFVGKFRTHKDDWYVTGDVCKHLHNSFSGKKGQSASYVKNFGIYWMRIPELPKELQMNRLEKKIEKSDKDIDSLKKELLNIKKLKEKE